MRRLLIATFLFLLATTAFAHGRNRGMSISIDDDWRDVTDCSDVRVTFDGDRVPMQTQEISVGRGPLKISSDHHGGIYVNGWEGSGFSVKACKANDTDVNPSSIRITNTAEGLSVDGPDSGQWVVYFLVRAPRGATLDLSATNGPITLAGVDGTVKARVQNGPISLKETSGKIDARAQNGPISLTGGSGDVILQAQNGPVSVKLAGTSWNGELDASTKNGPISLKIPRGFRSGVVVEQRGHGPITCRAEDCKRVSLYDDSDDDRTRRIELGSGTQNVRLSTVNGPVSVKDLE